MDNLTVFFGGIASVLTFFGAYYAYRVVKEADEVIDKDVLGGDTL